MQPSITSSSIEWPGNQSSWKTEGRICKALLQMFKYYVSQEILVGLLCTYEWASRNQDWPTLNSMLPKRFYFKQAHHVATILHLQDYSCDVDGKHCVQTLLPDFFQGCSDKIWVRKAWVCRLPPSCHHNMLQLLSLAQGNDLKLVLTTFNL
jgi:hypothetical protein